jgi:hypothetical protein
MFKWPIRGCFVTWLRITEAFCSVFITHMLPIPLVGEWCKVQGCVRGKILVYGKYIYFSNFTI